MSHYHIGNCNFLIASYVSQFEISVLVLGVLVLLMQNCRTRLEFGNRKARRSI